ncbi:OmpA family protein [Streptomyces graminilatus]|uniref:OmpA family protein n=1 Tax=Streptomyces graminilatus TaxID=1464070 RepID=UPI00099E4776|nr:OmpA family protein [Streptomyces graminilatus]
MSRRFVAALLGILVTAGILATAGCSAFSEVGSGRAARCTAPDGLALVVGVHRGVPAPPPADDLTPALKCAITETIRAERPVRLVLAGGHPRVISPDFESVKDGTLAEQGSNWVQDNMRKLNAEVARARPDAPGVDALEALAVAADALRSAGSERPELVLVDAGLNDHGALDFTVPGMLAADPSETAEAMRDSGNLPKKLRGTTVNLVGLGFTAPPQQELGDRWRSNLTDIYKEVLRAAGAQVTTTPRPTQGSSVHTPHTVKVARVPRTEPIEPEPGDTIVFRGDSQVRFEPNSLEFVDEKAAIRALEPIAQWLSADRSRHARLVGTTADVDLMSRQVRFSRQRADRVADLLIELGASARQLSTRGVGSAFPAYVPDHDAAGNLLSAPAALNRSVRIALSGPQQ